ncbi:MAG: glycosyltransferase family 4 protein [Candidatus Margulisbacteria bacterium]|nr:glycosyltransferase family 4 protein [Candidatus Margulisiibacteriota bacterium]
MSAYKILLISPVRDVDIYCGDIVYTESILNRPPEDIEYTDYVTALKNEDIVERKRLRFLWKNMKYSKFWIFQDFFPALIITIINIFRRKQWLFANPWKYFHIRNHFDLVHVHVFPVNLSGKVPPVVISNALTAGQFLETFHNYPAWRITVMEFMEKGLCKIFNIIETSVCYKKVKKIILFSEVLKNEYLKKGADPDKIRVIPIGLPSYPVNYKIKDPSQIIIGFIAKDFYAKGGWYLLQAYKKLYPEKKNLQLFIIGCEQLFNKKELEPYRIEWLNFVPREKLLKDYFSKFDIFAYPTVADGFPLVVLEALSMSIPVLTSDLLAMPEMIGYGEAGEISEARNIESIYKKLNLMTDMSYLEHKKAAALKFFKNKYHIYNTNLLLGRLYKECILDKVLFDFIDTPATKDDPE